MPYLIEKKIKGRKYFYIISSVKMKGRVKRFQSYVGTKKPSTKEFRLRAEALKRRVKEFLKKSDPLLSIIPDVELRGLEKSKSEYKRLMKRGSAVVENYYEWFVTQFTYDTNAIEGSTLTLRETAMVLFEGISPSGRSLHDVRTAENHKKAYDWMVSHKGDIDKQFILKLHRILTDGILKKECSGKIRNVSVYIRGAPERPPRPEEIEPQLRALIKWYNSGKRKYHPVVLASYFHTAFEGIHPFVDFNGRTGRLLLNFILLKNGYPPIDIRNEDKESYYNAIRAAVIGNIEPFANLVIRYIKEFKS